MRLCYRSFCGRSDPMNTNYNRFFQFFFHESVKEKGKEREKEEKRAKERPNFFFCLLYLYFFLISVFIYLIFSAAFVCLCVLSLLMPFSHSAYIEFCLKEFNQILFFYLYFGGCFRCYVETKKEIREKLDAKPEKSE